MLYKKWEIGAADPAASQALAAEAHTGQLLSDILVSRGITTAQQAAELLDTTGALPDPFLLKDMDKAVQRIHEAVENDELIVVFGDYDVDGITATALLYTYLDSTGAQVYYKLPSRSDDGYGLSEALVDQVADSGITLIVTVDTGTSAFEAAEHAKARGVDIVMTDHHLPQGHLPEAVAIVNPCREEDESGCENLSGVGVAFMLVAALEECTPEELLPVFGDLVAVGTVADVMKLTGINRTLVKAGLASLRETERPGLAALIAACGWQGKEITAENVSFGLAPRLNAAGRMDDATDALRLLLAEDEEEAQALVQNLQEQNTARQKAEQEISDTIIQQIEAEEALLHSRILVVWGDGWHQGVIGIVASRLTDKFAKPAIVIAFEGDEGRGSGRSYAGFSLYGAVASCEDILIRYGGHDLAAGLSISRAQVEEFRRRVNEWAAEASPVMALPKMQADVAIKLEDIGVPQVAELERLAPCGSGNPSPRFVLAGAVIDGVYPVSDGKHSRLRLRQGQATIYAVLFGAAPGALAYGVGDTVDVILALSVYDGKVGPQLSGRVLEMRPAGLGNEHVLQSALFESFAAHGKLTPEQKQLLYPAREDVADVYRVLRGGSRVTSQDMRPLFALLGEERAGRALTAVTALEELDLIRQDKTTGTYMLVPAQSKKDLSQSVLLQRLEV